MSHVNVTESYPTFSRDELAVSVRSEAAHHRNAMNQTVKFAAVSNCETGIDVAHSGVVAMINGRFTPSNQRARVHHNHVSRTGVIPLYCGPFQLFV